MSQSVVSLLPYCSTKTLGELDYLSVLVKKLQEAVSLEEKIRLLEEEERVSFFLDQYEMNFSSKEEEWVIKSVLAIGQEHIFLDEGVCSANRSKELIECLLTVDSFYEEMGGLIGYHVTLLEFLCRPKQRFPVDKAKIHAPLGMDFSESSSNLTEAIYYAIEGMDALSELYPIGGAADRLRLQDAVTGVGMPAALLSFNGKTMLGKLVEDLQAREYLYYKLKKRQITIPIAMMTSQEKDNHHHVLRLCQQNAWFHRPKEKFNFFCQPLVPVADREGSWVTLGPERLLLKPGGHGVIWKLARDTGVLSWLQAQGASKAIVRQINNPISSEDYGLLAFSGYGLKNNKRFGFASCERQVKASEGVNVVIEEEKKEGFSYTLTNIEYCDFPTYNIEDEPVEQGNLYSKFPSNTNLLFVDLSSVEKALEKCPIPGMLVNVKKVTFYDALQQKKEKEVARLESTMQNIADCFDQHFSEPLASDQLDSLDTYITFNKRRKTISAAKKEYSLGSSFLETPEGCFLDVISNTRELLEEHCLFTLPKQKESFTHPPFLFRYHPALGPLYALIGKKIRKGSLSLGSELHLQIAECDIENLSLEGSLLVLAERVMGHVDEAGILRYSEKVGRCTLKNVKVQNAGIDYEKENIFWKHHLYRKQSLRIILEGESEFHAEDVTFIGDQEIRVEDGYKIIAKEVDGIISLFKEKLTPSAFSWEYSFASDKEIVIKKSSNDENIVLTGKIDINN